MGFRISWADAVRVVIALYRAILQGKPIPGVPGATFPDQGHGPTFPDRSTPRGLLDPKLEEGLRTPIAGRIVAFIVVSIFVVPLLLLIVAGAIEAKTLSDGVPGNHLTAQLRAVFARQPAACALALAVWLALLASVFFGVLSHAWWF